MVDDLLSGSSPAPDDLNTLNRALASAPVIRQLDGGSLQLVPTTWGISAVAGTIAASFADLLAHGDPARIVTCANPDCRWVMLDESRNRSRKWCDKAECGNLMKVRKHRQKKRALRRPEKTR